MARLNKKQDFCKFFAKEEKTPESNTNKISSTFLFPLSIKPNGGNTKEQFLEMGKVKMLSDRNISSE
jgi:hypothetical protein